MSKKKKQDDFVDDGRTVANMDFDTISNRNHPKRAGHQNIDYRKRQQELSNLNLTWKERWAIIRAIYLRMIPFMILTFLIIFFSAFLLLSFWGM